MEMAAGARVAETLVAIQEAHAEGGWVVVESATLRAYVASDSWSARTRTEGISSWRRARALVAAVGAGRARWCAAS